MANNIDNKKKCDAARKIKKVLLEGYVIKEWINSEGDPILVLCGPGEYACAGVYIQFFEKHSTY